MLRMEEKAKEAAAAKNKTYEEYDWESLMKEKSLKKLRVRELDKYLLHHKLKKMLKYSKADKVHFIQRHWHEQRLQHKGETENQREADDEVEEEKDEEKEEEEDEEDNEESNNIVLAIIGHEEEYAEMSVWEICSFSGLTSFRNL